MRRCARRRALFLQPTKRRTDDLVDSVTYGLLGAVLAHADRAGARAGTESAYSRARLPWDSDEHAHTVARVGLGDRNRVDDLG